MGAEAHANASCFSIAVTTTSDETHIFILAADRMEILILSIARALATVKMRC